MPNIGFWATAGGGAAASYWIGMLTASGSETAADAGVAAVDASGNLYIAIRSDTSDASSDFVIAKYNSSGTIQWQRQFGDSGSENLPYDIAVDSSGNVCAVGTTTISGSTGVQVVKYNSSGTIQWQKRLRGSTTSSAYGVATDSSDNIYIGGRNDIDGTGNYRMLIAKYNSSGTIQWQRRLGDTNSSNWARSVATDSSGNLFIGGNDGLGYWAVAKYDSSGTIQWQRKTTNNSSGFGRGITVDSSGNNYSVGPSSSNGPASIKKYNSSGSIQWWESIGTSGQDTAYAVAKDSSNNLYLVGRASTTTSNALIVKYNSSGTIQWQRTISTTGTEQAFGIAISGDSMYITGHTNISGNNDIFFAKLPTDGSKTGTYTVGSYSFTYAASSLTTASVSPTDTVGGMTDATESLTESTTTQADAAGSLTSTVTTI